MVQPYTACRPTLPSRPAHDIRLARPILSLLAISDGLTPSEFPKYPYMIWIKGKSAEQT
jgi:hypothetical protein